MTDHFRSDQALNFPCILLVLALSSVSSLWAGEPSVNIGLGGKRTSLTILFPSGGQMKTMTGKTLQRFKAGEKFSWSCINGKRKKKSVRYSGQVLKFVSKGDRLSISGKPYRGSFKITFSGSGANVVNEVSLENYVKGVVGSEIGSKSPSETLKAQTVIARTYAFANKNRHGSSGFDLCDSTHCQVYNGINAERPSIAEAVSATRGIIMICEGEPIATLYHATCGGMTSDNDKVFGGAPRAFLRRVKCPFCSKGTNYRWTRRIPHDDLVLTARKENIRFSRLLGIQIQSPAPLDRVDYVKLITDKGEFRIKGTTFRRHFNLPSTTFILNSSAKLKETKVESRNSGEEVFRKTIQPSLFVMGGQQSAGPQQMIIQTGKGLARTLKPADGWMILGIGELESKPLQEEESAAGNEFTHGLSDNAINILGRGYGHQVGLCQAGALEMGRRGWSYRQILAYYYSNTALRRLKY